MEYLIKQYPLESGALEIQYIEEYFGEFPRKKTAREIVARLKDRGWADLVSLLPEGPFLDPPEAPTDQPLEVLLAELVREQVLRRTFQEVPHSVEVVIEELDTESRPELVFVRARIWVETDSQKGILIGKQGRMIKTVGTAGRRALEQELGQRVHLDLRVDVRKRWRADERLLDRLGIE